MKFFRKPKKISWKLTLVYSSMFILILLALNTSVYFILNNYIEREVKNSINSTLQYVLPQLQRSQLWRSTSYGAELLREISEIEGNIYFRILNQEGQIMAESKVLKDVELPAVSGFNTVREGDKNFMYSTTELPFSLFTNGYLQIVRDKKVETEFMKQLFNVLVFTSVVGSIVAIMIGYTVTRKTLKPISQMIKTVNNITVSDLSQRLEEKEPRDELTELAETFNSMLDRLEEAFYRQQQFVSDASHELRTPISVIQGYIDLLDRWGKEEAEIRDEAIEAIKKEVTNIKSMMESLLFLARGDSEDINVNRQEFDFNELISEIIRETSLLEEEHHLDVDIEANLRFYGDRRLIKQMIRIFVDNSIKYTPAGGDILIQAFEEEASFVIKIKDTGEGIPEEEIPHIFERFYRVDESRSEKKGTGLGLSIASWIIEIHGGEIEVESTVGEGTIITVEFSDNVLNNA